MPHRRAAGSHSPSAVTDARQPISQLLERFFTPGSAQVVEKALGAMTQQAAEEERAQGHALSSGLAALHRGEPILVGDLDYRV